MSTRAATVLPLRAARFQELDLALALAILDKGVKAHERARRTRLAAFARSPFRILRVYSNAKSLGA